MHFYWKFCSRNTFLSGIRVKKCIFGSNSSQKAHFLGSKLIFQVKLTCVWLAFSSSLVSNDESVRFLPICKFWNSPSCKLSLEESEKARFCIECIDKSIFRQYQVTRCPSDRGIEKLCCPRVRQKSKRIYGRGLGKKNDRLEMLVWLVDWVAE